MTCFNKKTRFFIKSNNLGHRAMGNSNNCRYLPVRFGSMVM